MTSTAVCIGLEVHSSAPGIASLVGAKYVGSQLCIYSLLALFFAAQCCQPTQVLFEEQGYRYVGGRRLSRLSQTASCGTKICHARARLYEAADSGLNKVK